MLKIPESSSPAVDNFLPFILKTGASVIAPFAFILLTQIVISLTWPVSWESAYITPLHKSASKADIKNNRVISILPRISPGMGKVLYNFTFEKIRHKLSDSQHGFRSRKITFKPLLDYVDKLYFSNHKNDDFRCVYFDFKKKQSTVFHSTDYFIN